MTDLERVRQAYNAAMGEVHYAPGSYRLDYSMAEVNDILDAHLKEDTAREAEWYADKVAVFKQWEADKAELARLCEENEDLKLQRATDQAMHEGENARLREALEEIALLLSDSDDLYVPKNEHAWVGDIARNALKETT